MRTNLRWIVVATYLTLWFSTSLAQPPKDFTNSAGMKFVLIPSGRFTMGSAPSDQLADEDERPFEVTISKPFYMGTTEVTQAQYQKIMGANPSNFKNSQNADDSRDLPVEQVSWEDAVEFCKRLSLQPDEKQSNRVYRLPSEAQWEYACRAGKTGPFGFDASAETLEQFAWFADNSGNKALDSRQVWKASQEDIEIYIKTLKANGCRTHSVGKKKPNAFGLHDMHGNVWEWCSDWYGDYPKGQAADPVGPARGTDRVIRGGGFHFQPQDCRSAERHGSFPSNRVDDLGFRVILPVD